MKSRKKIIQGGTSAGKTWAILPILIDKACKNPNTEISVVSESIPHLRRGALKDFLNIMKLTNRFISRNFNKTHLKYEFTNGSFIEFFSCDDETRLRGARRHILYVNEANNISYDSYLQLSIRTSGDIYIDFNPTSRFWCHTEVLSEPDAEIIILNYLDNEALDASIINELEIKRSKALTSDYWANWWKVYGLGEVGSLDGVIFSNWKEIDNIPEEANIIGIGLDFGYTNDPTAAVAVYKYNDTIILDELIYLKGLGNSEIASLLKGTHHQCQIFADSAEPKSIAELNRYGLRVTGANKGRDSINFGISILQDYEMLVTKRSHNLMDELNKYQWTKDKDGKTSNVPMDAFNHTLDAIRYLAISKLKKVNSVKTFKII